MAKTVFLCTSCRREMCDDCKNIADEYAELLTLKNRALSSAEHTIKEMKGKLESAKRRAATFERIAKMGMPEVILAWMDSEAIGLPKA